MKIQHYLAATAVILATAACSSDDEATTTGLAGDIVQIQPSIGNTVATRTNPEYINDEGKKSLSFNAGDTIMVNLDKSPKDNGTAFYDNFYPYAYDGSKWTPVKTGYDPAYLKWPADFQPGHVYMAAAYYPSTASFEHFTLPTDQSTHEKIAKADFMRVQGYTQATEQKNTLKFDLSRWMNRISVVIDRFGNQFDAAKTTCKVRIKSPYSEWDESANTEYNYDYGTGSSTWITPLYPDGKTELQQGDSAIALIIPSLTGVADEEFIEVVTTTTKSDGSTESDTLYVRGIPAHKDNNSYVFFGSSYTYKLKIGKDAIAVSSVTVRPWTGKTIGNGEATEQSNP